MSKLAKVTRAWQNDTNWAGMGTLIRGINVMSYIIFINCQILFIETPKTIVKIRFEERDPTKALLIEDCIDCIVFWAPKKD